MYPSRVLPAGICTAGLDSLIEKNGESIESLNVLGGLQLSYHAIKNCQALRVYVGFLLIVGPTELRG